MTNALKMVWQFKGYFKACAIYSVVCTIMMIEPQLGAWFCWPALLAVAGIEWVGRQAGVDSNLLGNLVSLHKDFFPGMLLVVSLYSLLLFLPMAMNVIRPRWYWKALQVAIIIAQPFVGLLVAGVTLALLLL